MQRRLGFFYIAAALVIVGGAVGWLGAPRVTPQVVVRASAALPSIIAVPNAVEEAAVAAPAATPPQAIAAARPASLGASIPVTLTAPAGLLVGETGEIAVAIDSYRSIRRISFVARFDANVLQVRGAAQGDWMGQGGVDGDFTQEVEPGDGSVRIQGRSGARPPLSGAGTLALIQVQAMAPGNTTITLTDFSAEDGEGNPVSIGVSPAGLRLAVGNTETIAPPARTFPEPTSPEPAATTEGD